MTLIRPVIAGILLALLSYVGDDVDFGLEFETALLLSAVTSSGLVWGLAAFLIGSAERQSRRRAAVAATILLVSATTTYYLMILLVSRRWSGGTLVDGSSGDTRELLSVALMTGIWLAASLAGGPVLGLLGHTVRTGAGRLAAAAAGGVCGLLASEATYRMLIDPMAAYGRSTGVIQPSFGPSVLLGVALPLLVMVWLATRHRLWRHWPTLMLTLCGTAVGGSLLWLAVESIVYRFF